MDTCYDLKIDASYDILRGFRNISISQIFWITLPDYFIPFSLQVIKVYSEDNTSRAVEVPTDITARDICQLFVLKNHCIDDHSWTLFEHLSHLGIGKSFFTVCHLVFCVVIMH